ncbi:MAG: hypothetical protein ACYTG0_17135 [Planctomycetota bacterium]|jgi:hypothetical protein
MVGILLDAAVILGLVYVFNEGEIPGWGTAIATALAVGFGFLGCAYYLAPHIGLFSLLPMALVAGVVLCIACEMPVKKALIAGVILFVYKMVFALLVLAFRLHE